MEPDSELALVPARVGISRGVVSGEPSQPLSCGLSFIRAGHRICGPLADCRRRPPAAIARPASCQIACDGDHIVGGLARDTHERIRFSSAVARSDHQPVRIFILLSHARERLLGGPPARIADAIARQACDIQNSQQAQPVQLRRGAPPLIARKAAEKRGRLGAFGRARPRPQAAGGASHGCCGAVLVAGGVGSCPGCGSLNCDW